MNILELLRKGYSVDQVASITGIEGKAIGGIISTAKHRGDLPKDFVANREDLAVDASISSAPSGATQGAAPATPAPTGTQVPSPSPDGSVWKEMSPGVDASGESVLYYQVERQQPDTDDLMKGVLAKFDHLPTDDEIGRRFGSGTYMVTRHEPGRPITFKRARISNAFGPPRNPRIDQSRRSGYRPFGARDSAFRDPEDGLPPREFYRRPPYPDRPMPPRDDDDRHSLAEFARHGAAAGEGIAVAAVQQLGKIHELTLKQKEDERKGGPQTFLTTFLENQQNVERRQREAERQREEKRREEERQQIEERRREEQRQWERRQEELDKQHRRELERIAKEAEHRERRDRERQQELMTLYDKRMELAEKEARIAQERLKSELERSHKENREDRAKLMAELKELTNQSSNEIASMKEELKEELERERNTLKEHHQIRMQSLQNEHALRQDILKIREDNLKQNTGDSLEKILKQLAGGIENTIREVVDLKKIQAVSGLSPEAQAAHVDANARPEGSSPGQLPGAGATAPQPQPQPRVVVPPEEPRSGNGNGAQVRREAENMESAVVANMNKPFFQDVLKEWVLHVESGNDAIILSNMFMEWMRDDSTPEAAATRKTCSDFTTFITVRSWEQVFKIIRPALSEEQIAVLEKPEAQQFYDQFRTIVVESVRDYYKSYLREKLAQQQQRAAAQAPADATPEVPAHSDVDA